MNKDEEMDKQRLGLFCILAPCSRTGYKSFHVSHKGRSCSFSFWFCQNIPISDWARFTESLVPIHCCLFWRWTGDGIDLLSGVVVLRLSPAEVQGAYFFHKGRSRPPQLQLIITKQT